MFSHRDPSHANQLIDVTRAAKLAGVPAAVIEGLIKAESLPHHKGMIEYSELAREFPELDHSKGSMIEIVSQIKDNALIKALKMRPGYRNTGLASVKQELKQTQEELEYYKRQYNRYKNVIIDLRPRLERLKENSEHKNRIHAIIVWFVHNTKELWKS